MKEKIKNTLSVYCIIFTFITILSSAGQLFNGIPKDDNLHIINRSVVVFIGVLTLFLIAELDLKNKILNIVVPYAIAMAMVFFYVWLTSFWDELHPSAYRDIFFNFTAFYILMAIVVEIKNRFKRKPKKGY